MALLYLPTSVPGAFVSDSRAGSGRVVAAAAAKSEDKRAVRFERSVADLRSSELGLRSWCKKLRACTVFAERDHGYGASSSSSLSTNQSSDIEEEVDDKAEGAQDSWKVGDEGISEERRIAEEQARRRQEELVRAADENRISYGNEVASRHTATSSNERMDGLLSSDDEKEMEKNRMNRVCDKLIDLFLVEETSPEEWHRYLTFSKEWVNIRPSFFRRCKYLAARTEDLKRRTNLLILSRRLKELDEDMQQHDKLLSLIEKSPTEIDAIVARQRKHFTEHFFEHLRFRIQASYDDQKRREEIAAIAKNCLATVQEYDRKAKDFMSLSAAQMKFDDIVKSPSLGIASKKIEDLAKKGELDSSLMLLISKAYSASKESTLMKEEAKDTLLQLYNVARGNMSRLVPKEVRILRYLLSINDPQERSAEIRNSLTPGLELEGKDVDELYTTPEALSMTIQNLLDAFDTNRQGALMKEARKLIQPSVIGRLRAIKQELESQYM